jgi:L-glyceraldehyde 3-phosphate reductase
MTYVPADDRYEHLRYRRSGRSGLQLPAVSLGLWQNFGYDRPLDTSRAIVCRAFDLGITHFDLANNYGPPYGSAEANFGLLMQQDLLRDELIVSSKAGEGCQNLGSAEFLTPSGCRVHYCRSSSGGPSRVV